MSKRTIQNIYTPTSVNQKHVFQMMMSLQIYKMQTVFSNCFTSHAVPAKRDVLITIRIFVTQSHFFGWVDNLDSEMVAVDDRCGI